MQNYDLGYISNEDIYNHVRDTVLHYRTKISLKEFSSNLIDPIKLTFDSKIYGKSIPEIIESECIRQIDKTNTNHIGYFHQNLFKYIGNGWYVPEQGWDVVNDQQHIFVELKNKHNTMNSASSQKTYMKMQNKILRDDRAQCMLVEVIAKNSQNITWLTSLDGETFSNDKIRRVSIDKFYGIVTGDDYAFKKLCQKIPLIIDDVIFSLQNVTIDNTVFSELNELSADTLKSLYLLSFQKYDGFNSFEVD